MPETRHAIMIASDARGWMWQVIDPYGVTAASGVSTNQDRAMEAAWRAAKHAPEFGRSDYPEISIRHGEDARRA